MSQKLLRCNDCKLAHAQHYTDRIHTVRNTRPFAEKLIGSENFLTPPLMYLEHKSSGKSIEDFQESCRGKRKSRRHSVEISTKILPLRFYVKSKTQHVDCHFDDF